MKTFAALCLVLVIAAVNGGGFALAHAVQQPDQPLGEVALMSAVEQADDSCDAIVSSHEKAPVQLAVSSGYGHCSNGDCGWVVPSVGTLNTSHISVRCSASTTALWAMADGLQLPPPRS